MLVRIGIRAWVNNERAASNQEMGKLHSTPTGHGNQWEIFWLVSQVSI
jgi:hypothetical protein